MHRVRHLPAIGSLRTVSPCSAKSHASAWLLGRPVGCLRAFEQEAGLRHHESKIAHAVERFGRRSASGANTRKYSPGRLSSRAEAWLFALHGLTVRRLPMACICLIWCIGFATMSEDAGTFSDRPQTLLPLPPCHIDSTFAESSGRLLQCRSASGSSQEPSIHATRAA